MFKDGTEALARASCDHPAAFGTERGADFDTVPMRDPSPSANHNNLVRAMRQHPVFAYLTYTQFQEALTASHADDFDAGTVLYERGATARHFFIVVEGRVNLSLFSRAGDEKVIEILGPGKILGEVGMFSEGGTYPVTAVVSAKSRIARLSNRDYLSILQECPATCLRMLAHLAERIERHVQQIECSTLETATDRLVHMLEARLPQDVDGPSDVWLDESRQDLASYLSMKPETLSRALRALTMSGAISVHGRQIRVPSRGRLLQQLEAALQ